MKTKCENKGCGFESPIGYQSPRGWCADCEYRKVVSLTNELIKDKRSFEEMNRVMGEVYGRKM